MKDTIISILIITGILSYIFYLIYTKPKEIKPTYEIISTIEGTYVIKTNAKNEKTLLKVTKMQTPTCKEMK